MLECFVYFLVFGVVFALNSVAVKEEKKKKRRLLIALGFSILVLFIGLRSNVGTDYNGYLELYENLKDVQWSDLLSLRVEILTSLIFKSCAMFFSEPRMIFIVVAIIQLLPVYLANKIYNNKYLPLSILLYCMLFLPFCLNGMRQGIAMGFALLSFAFIGKKKVAKACISIIIASLFHMSALVCIPYILLLAVIKKKSIVKLNIIITAVMAYVVLFVLNGVLMDYGVDRYNYILGGIDTEALGINKLLVFLPIIVINIVLLIRGNDNDMEKRNISNLAIDGHIFYYLGSAAKHLYRFGLYFMMSDLITIPCVIESIKNERKRKMATVALFIYLAVFFYVQFYIWGRHEIIPYNTWIFSV